MKRNSLALLLLGTFLYLGFGKAFSQIASAKKPPRLMASEKIDLPTNNMFLTKEQVLEKNKGTLALENARNLKWSLMSTTDFQQHFSKKYKIPFFHKTTKLWVLERSYPQKPIPGKKRIPTQEVVSCFDAISGHFIFNQATSG